MCLAKEHERQPLSGEGTSELCLSEPFPSHSSARAPGRGQPRRAQRKQRRLRGAGDPEWGAELQTHRPHHAAGRARQDRRGVSPEERKAHPQSSQGLPVTQEVRLARAVRGEQAFASDCSLSLSPSLGSPHCTSLVRVMLQKSAQDLIGPGSGPQNSRSRGWRAPSRGRRAVPQRRAQ